MTVTPLRRLCLGHLAHWLPFAAKHLRRSRAGGPPDLYGPGSSSHWDIQAQATAATAFAVASADPEMTGDREALANTALAMMRYLFQSHASGSGACLDGQPWGRSWISVLALERLGPAIDLFADRFDDVDRAALARMLQDEARSIPEVFPLVASPDASTGRNHPESNMWSGTFLHRVALRYPGHPSAARWREQGTDYLVNGISVPADSGCGDVFDGRTVAQRHVGANFFSSYACNHHGYLNIGYKYITLSNLALLHFSLTTAGQPLPHALEHNARGLWDVVKTMTFPSGRLWRLGGDSRVRYCYCQDWAMPAWLWAKERYGDPDGASLAEQWMKIVDAEAKENADGSFFGRRLAPLRSRSPLYWLRLEGDRAACLAITAWRERVANARVEPAAGPLAAERPGEWSDEFHGAFQSRSRRRAASWCWEAAEKPNGLCVPTDRDDLAEWRHTLAGQVCGMGAGADRRTVVRKEGRVFPGGFVTSGRYVARMTEFWSEGGKPHDTATVDLAVAALPDDATLLVLQRAVSPHGMDLREAKGLYLPIPNDFANRHERRWLTPAGRWHWQGAPARDTTERTGGPWLVLDGRLALAGLYGGEEFLIHRPALARGHIISNAMHHLRARWLGGELRLEEICFGLCHEGEEWRPEPDTVLWDIGCAVRTLDAEESSFQPAAWQAAARGATVAAAPSPSPEADQVRVAAATGRDGREYRLAANWGEAEALLPWPSDWHSLDADGTAAGRGIVLPARTARVFRRAAAKG